MGKRNDQVFQLSLTEIAFTIVFLLLLLLGYLVFNEQQKAAELQAQLGSRQTAERAAAAAQDARRELAEALSGAGQTPVDEVLTKLVAAQEARADNERLKRQVEDLDARLSALAEVKVLATQAAGRAAPETTEEEVLSALAIQKVVREELGSSAPTDSQVAPGPQPIAASPNASGRHAGAKPERRQVSVQDVRSGLRASAELKRRLKEQLGEELRPGDEKKIVAALVDRARQYGAAAGSANALDAARKESADLRGQVAFLKNRLEARGGRDYPPCWADESGRPEYLFDIELRSDVIKVTQAWRPHREADARALPGLDKALGELPHGGFRDAMGGILEWSKKRDPQCRHYVQLRSQINDAVVSDRTRLMVEDFFYKSEVRR